ncbi:Asp23/Gls24 family envelope stress response protein [Lacticaseibacillus paracasei]|uniref:Asp23/Gls24 family envelope stress response protein n=1 Tax=Lacticaseibacillus paracasei TaxID=1597 RepID=UPI00124B3572|nr:Asp23/Gls24 family envelope stress response protein [Lacticaseibacillus paracasei]KAB1967687.1 Asp23/Gls24 family envelope stress response protein [Lacticaseibacillus paracasei]MCT3332220.1 Asp23/Gls24 family envelope stress response protein [Lacticaseibacillus paracasei]WPP11515.1 Asp23/Gls24 family envelope stress response protein [Lacticaseibacillus paracasei]WQG48348.1 Asp23/Gls24 family envelope stress response protein [Lacticaseibacillus casei]
MDAVATPPVAASPAVTRETLMANSRLTFEDKVIEKIAALCAREIDSLLGMDGTMMDNLTETFSSGENITKGISAEVGEKQVAIDMDVFLAFDSDAQAIFKQLCEKISAQITRMTGLQLVELNLHVKDVLTKREWQKK